MTPFQKACAWTFVAISVLSIGGMMISHCTTPLSESDLRIIESWQGRWPRKDTLGVAPVDDLE